ncbi:MAG: HDIG domain-containing protein [Bacteroidetes bacterium]|nr:HDIG domain-containing protein [Bacteroidota bacterium]
MERNKALELLNEYVKNPKMISHCLASEAVMRALAIRLDENPDKWGLAGLLHDVDVEVTNADPLTHSMESVKILDKQRVDPEIIEAIMLHNENASHNQKRSKKLHFALAAGETITGLIFATALVYPDKKISSVKTKSITKRMKEKAFAASVKRENIMECEKIGLSLEEFAEISLKAMIDIEV